MSVQGPPEPIARALESVAPGIFRAFFGALGTAHRGLRYQATSFWRSRQDNARVGGASDSQHLIATAVDLTYPTSKEREAAKMAMRAQGLVVIDEGDHVHVQAWPAATAQRVIRWLRL